MKAKALNGITEIKRSGISVRIRSIIKDGTTYYVLDDRVAGKRKLVWRSTLADARAAADEAIDNYRRAGRSPEPQIHGCTRLHPCPHRARMDRK